MITVYLHDDKYIALQSDFAHKDDIKALADYPEVKWDASSKRWLVDARLFWKVIAWFGDVLTPLSLDVVFGYPIPAAEAIKRSPRRRNWKAEKAQREEMAEATKGFGKTIIEYGRSRR